MVLTIRRFMLICALLLSAAGRSFAASVVLEWDAVTTNDDSTAITDLAGYAVYRATNSFMSPVTLSTSQAAALPFVTRTAVGDVTSYTVTNLALATTYYFRITALDTDGNESAFNRTAGNAEVEVSTVTPPYPDLTAPAIPAGFAAVAISSAQVRFRWSANTEGDLSGYRLSVSSEASFSTFLSGYEEKDLGIMTTVLLDGLEPDTTYYGSLKAYDTSANLSTAAPVAFALTPADNPGIDCGAIPAQINISRDAIAVFVQLRPCGRAPITMATLAYGMPGDAGLGRTVALQPLREAPGTWRAVIPSTATALSIGSFRCQITCCDARGRESRSAEYVIKIVHIVETAVSADGTVVLGLDHPEWGKTQANFGDVPSGERPSTVAIEQLPATDYSADSDERLDAPPTGRLPLAVYSFTAEQQHARVFSGAVTLTLTYPDVPSGADPAKFRIFYRDTSGKWKYLGGTVDTARHTVTVETRHFSIFAVFQARTVASAADIPKEQFISPALQDGYNDVAGFDVSVTEVDIFDTMGHQVFSSRSDGVSAIEWTGRENGSGGVVESGAYIARLRTASGATLYQTIVVVK